MTGPSSGDRPAEETCGSLIPFAWHEQVRCRMPAGHDADHWYEDTGWSNDESATPPAVRTGDDDGTGWKHGPGECVSAVYANQVLADERAAHTRTMDRLARLLADSGQGPHNAALFTPPPVSGMGKPGQREGRAPVSTGNSRPSLARRPQSATSQQDTPNGSAPGTDRVVHLGQAGALAVLAEELERAGEVRAADLADRTAKFYRQWADNPAVVPPETEPLPDLDDEPVSGTATRDDVARWLMKWDNEQWDRADEEYRDYYRGHADELLALGGSQPAQPAEEQRPIDVLAERWDGGLRARVEALAAEWDRETDALGFVLRPLARLRRALDGDGGDRG